MFTNDFSMRWDGKTGHVVKGGEGFRLDHPPGASFAYDELYAEEDRVLMMVAGEGTKLTKEQKEEIAGYIAGVTNSALPYAHCIGDKGQYLGKINPNLPAVAGIVRGTPPNQGNWYWSEPDGWTLIQGVDADGNWVENATFDTIAEMVPGPPEHADMRWDFEAKDWRDTRPVGELKPEARQQVEESLSLYRAAHCQNLFGQPQIDFEKMGQARDVAASGYTVDPEKHDWVHAEIRARAVSGDENIAAVVNGIINALTLARRHFRISEEARIAAMAAIEDATTSADLNAAVVIVDRIIRDQRQLLGLGDPG